eukprot:scaffold340_cov256-Pinguiococcus_pyrenoidosus.AAC.47
MRQLKAPFHDLGSDPLTTDLSQRLIGKDVGNLDEFYGKLQHERPPPFANVFLNPNATGSVSSSAVEGSPQIAVNSGPPTTSSNSRSEARRRGEDGTLQAKDKDETLDTEKTASPFSRGRRRLLGPGVHNKSSSSVGSREESAAELRARLERVFESLRFSAKDQCELLAKYCDIHKAKVALHETRRNEMARVSTVASSWPSRRNRVSVWEKAAIVVNAREKVVDFLDGYAAEEHRSLQSLFTDAERDELLGQGIHVQVPDAVSQIEGASSEERFVLAKKRLEASGDKGEHEHGNEEHGKAGTWSHFTGSESLWFRLLVLKDSEVCLTKSFARAWLQGGHRSVYSRILEVMQADAESATRAAVDYLCRWKALLDHAAQELASEIEAHGDVLLYDGRPYATVMHAQQARSTPRTGQHGD